MGAKFYTGVLLLSISCTFKLNVHEMDKYITPVHFYLQLWIYNFYSESNHNRCDYYFETSVENGVCSCIKVTSASFSRREWEQTVSHLSTAGNGLINNNKKRLIRVKYSDSILPRSALDHWCSYKWIKQWWVTVHNLKCSISKKTRSRTCSFQVYLMHRNIGLQSLFSSSSAPLFSMYVVQYCIGIRATHGTDSSNISSMRPKCSWFWESGVAYDLQYHKSEREGCVDKSVCSFYLG